jgi:hypothetical protein
LDKEEIGFTVAVAISFLGAQEQEAIDACLQKRKYKVSMKKALLLREASQESPLQEADVLTILEGEEKRGSQSVRLSQDICEEYFQGKSKEEIQDLVERALRYYVDNNLD